MQVDPPFTRGSTKRKRSDREHSARERIARSLAPRGEETSFDGGNLLCGKEATPSLTTACTTSNTNTQLLQNAGPSKPAGISEQSEDNDQLDGLGNSIEHPSQSENWRYIRRFWLADLVSN